MSKRDDDYLSGDAKRLEIDGVINTAFKKAKYTCQISPLHKNRDVLPIWKKIKSCVFKNFVFSRPIEEAMGLARILTDKHPDNGILVTYFIKNKAGFYLKIPMNLKENYQIYLQFLDLSEAHALIVEEVENKPYKYKFSYPLPFKMIKKYWKCKMSTSPGNTNRLQFYSNIRKNDIICYKIDEKISLERKSVLFVLNKLVNK